MTEAIKAGNTKGTAISGWRKAVVACVALAAGGLASACFAHDPYYEGPPPGYVATVEPYYYLGRPVYWWGGHWHYHDHGRWQRYHVEPAPLRDVRMRGGSGPRDIGPGRAAPMPSTGPRFGSPSAAPGRAAPRFAPPSAQPGMRGPRFGNPGASPGRAAPASGGGGPRFQGRPR